VVDVRVITEEVGAFNLCANTSHWADSIGGVNFLRIGANKVNTLVADNVANNVIIKEIPSHSCHLLAIERGRDTEVGNEWSKGSAGSSLR
jgi:hypothetical protein